MNNSLSMNNSSKKCLDNWFSVTYYIPSLSISDIWFQQYMPTVNIQNDNDLLHVNHTRSEVAFVCLFKGEW